MLPMSLDELILDHSALTKGDLTQQFRSNPSMLSFPNRLPPSSDQVKIQNQSGQEDSYRGVATNGVRKRTNGLIK